MKKVAIYSTPTCTYCKMAKGFFEEHGIRYDEYNAAADAVRRQEAVDKSGQRGVPVITVTSEEGEEQVIVGFDKEALTAALGL
jgi:glutaredoxin